MNKTTTNSYDLDPISLARYNEEELVTMLKEITNDAKFKDEDNSIELANKIVMYSDAQVIVVELLGRAQQLYDDAKLNAESETAKLMKEERENWEAEHPGNNKFPANTYFEGLAKSGAKKLWREVSDNKRMLDRYKRIRDNYETKINAAKKLLNALEMINY